MRTRSLPLAIVFTLTSACGAPAVTDAGRADVSASDTVAHDGCTGAACVDAMSPMDAPLAETGCTGADCDAGVDDVTAVDADDAGCVDCADVRTVDAGRDVVTRDAGGMGDAGDAGGVRGVTVVGARLQRDGADFAPHGFNMIGVLTPDACSSPPRAGTAARASFGMAELTAARDAWHANMVRLQVSQPGLDPMDPSYSAAYVTRVRNGVALARSLGLVVIVSMQDQSIGCGAALVLPTAATLRAWSTAAPLFRDDPYVLFELFNEPQNDPTTAGWAQWRDGGTSPLAFGQAAVGHQALVTYLRTTLHANNVLVADGANHAGKLQGIPHLVDTLSPPQIAYAVHPYYFHLSDTSTLAADSANWDMRFGYLTATVPVLATEWNASASCFAGQATRVTDFFAYLTAHHIGLFGHGFDVPDTMVTNLTSWTPTRFTGCVPMSDAGEMVQAYYATLPR